MPKRKPFIVVHQENVEECDTLEEALAAIQETQEWYHQGGYRIFDFEGGIYRLVEEGAISIICEENQVEYYKRFDKTLKPFAVVDKLDDKSLIGVTVGFQGRVLEIGKDIGVPETEYHGFGSFWEAKAEFEKRRGNDGGLYSLIIFHKVVGPDSKI